jgi:hypothetical protein
MNRRDLLAAFAVSASGCAGLPRQRPPLEAWLYRHGDRGFRRVLDQRRTFELQIRLSVVRADQTLAHFALDGGAGPWFWPASLIKLPLALIALEDLNARGLSREVLPTLGPREACAGEAEPFAETAPATVARFIERALIVSDNHASNVLFDALGRAAIQARLRAWGFPNARIVNRLAFCAPAAHAFSPAVEWRDRDGAMAGSRAALTDTQTYPPPFGPIRRGVGHIDGTTLIKKPRDFSAGNVLPLDDLHTLLIALIRADPRFKLRAEDRAWLIDTLGKLPRAAGFDPTAYPDAYAKFLLGGDRLDQPLPSGVRIHNKIGQAYGYLSDCAYVESSALKFFLSAALYVNADGVFNDDVYEYDTIGLPFLGQLGRLALQFGGELVNA